MIPAFAGQPILYKDRMQQLLLITLGGGLGALARYGIVLGASRLPLADFPYAVLCINILGSFFMGIVAGAGVEHAQITPMIRAFLMIGVLGGFTTFSSFSLDVVQLMQRGETIPAMIYMVSSVTLSVLALAIGMNLMPLVRGT